jgi:hypothetical protein
MYRFIFSIFKNCKMSSIHNTDTQTPFSKHCPLQIKVFVAMYYSTKSGFVQLLPFVLSNKIQNL